MVMSRAKQAVIERELRGKTADQWLEWLLEFAQEDLTDWVAADYRACGIRLKAFLLAQGFGISYTREPMKKRNPDGSPRFRPFYETPVPSAQDIRQAQDIVKSTLDAIAKDEPLPLLQTQVRHELRPTPNGPMLFTFEDYESPSTLPFPKAVAFHLARLIDRISHKTMEMTQGKGPTRLKQCAAPTPRQNTLCQRWFLGRPSQRYCSPLCQNRAGSKRFRQRAATT